MSAPKCESAERQAKRAEENKDHQWWVSYNTNALRIGVNPLWDAELGLQDDGTVIWRKIAPLK